MVSAPDSHEGIKKNGVQDRKSWEPSPSLSGLLGRRENLARRLLFADPSRLIGFSFTAGQRRIEEMKFHDEHGSSESSYQEFRVVPIFCWVGPLFFM